MIDALHDFLLSFGLLGALAWIESGYGATAPLAAGRVEVRRA